MYQGYVSRVSIKAMYLDYVAMYLDYVSSLCNSPRVLAEEPSPCFRELYNYDYSLYTAFFVAAGGKSLLASAAAASAAAPAQSFSEARHTARFLSWLRSKRVEGKPMENQWKTDKT